MSGDADTRPDIPAAWTTAALDAVIAHHKQRRDPIWNCPSSGEVAAIITVLRPLIAAAERERIRQMAERNNAVCVGDEGTSCYFADLIREEAENLVARARRACRENPATLTAGDVLRILGGESAPSPSGMQNPRPVVRVIEEGEEPRHG